MAVGENEPVGRDDDAGANAGTATSVSLAFLPAGLDPHHRGTNAIGDADHGMRIGVEQRRITRGGVDMRLRFVRVEHGDIGDIEHLTLSLRAGRGFTGAPKSAAALLGCRQI
jgi:hypothetical protein